MNYNFIIHRAKSLIIDPSSEWISIKNDGLNVKDSIREYALPFLIVVAAASFLGGILSTGISSISFILLMSLANLGVSYANIYLSGYVINKLAPSFASVMNFDNAAKLVLYSSTASYISSIVTGLVPDLFFLGLFGLYSIYLFWTGITFMMNTPIEKKLGYVIITAIINILIYSILSLFAINIITIFTGVQILNQI